jgi:hypothetical protein
MTNLLLIGSVNQRPLQTRWGGLAMSPTFDIGTMETTPNRARRQARSSIGPHDNSYDSQMSRRSHHE